MIGYPAVPAGRMHLGVKACIIAANRRAPAINCAGETRRLNLGIKKWLRADPPSSKGRAEDPPMATFRRNFRRIPATLKASSAPLADRVLAAFSVWQLRKPLLNGRHVHGLAAGGLRFLPVFVRSPAALPDRSL
jgi:hypothetical protein